MSYDEASTRIELALTRAASSGEVADFSSDKSELNDPKTGAGWSEERTVNATTIIDLCTKEDPLKPVHAKGIRLRGARIEGTLDFEAMKLLRPLYLEKCFLEKHFILTDAETKTLSLDGSYVPGISANRVKIRGSLFLRDGFISMGEIQMIDALIEGSISGRGARFKNPNGFAFTGFRMSVGGGFLMLGDFQSEGEISLIEAKLGGSLAFEGAKLNNKGKKTLDAERLTTKGGVYLRKRFRSFGRVKLHSAQVEGIVEFGAGTIDGSKDIAIEARGIRVKGAFILREGFATKGVVNLSFANIGATLECDNAHLNGGGSGHSLEASEATIGSSVNFRNSFTAQGPVSLDGASIGGSLTFENAIFAGDKPDKSVLTAARIILKQNLNIHKGSQFIGMVSLVGAEIGGNLHCRKAAFLNKRNTALDASLITVKGEVLFGNEFRSDGELRLIGSKVGAGLRLDSKEIKNADGVALNCERLLSAGAVSLNHSEISGELRLENADIGSDLLLTGAKIGSGREKIALSASGLSVKGSAFLNGDFEARGDVNLAHAHIGGELDCATATFNGKLNAFAAANIRVVQTLTWKEIKLLPGGHINLNGAAVGCLSDDCPSWPGQQQISINDLSYTSFGEQTLDLAQRLSWLRSQRIFSVQPYEQLARVLRNAGQDKEARKVARAKQDDLRKHGQMGLAPGAWNWLSGKTIGHGYQLWRALIASLLVVLIGTIIFQVSFANGVMLPIKGNTSTSATGQRCPEKIPCFNPVIYSLDVFLPIVDLQQESYWLPVANGPKRSLFEHYYWLHVTLGWIFTTLTVAGLTGLVKRE